MATTTKRSGSATADGPGTSAQGVSSPAVGSGFRRLNPVDGLFLRAEHLDQIQDHATDLVQRTASTVGSGVVHGFTLDLDGERLGSTAGLAVDPSGRALRSLHRIDVGLEDLAHDAGRVWMVEVVAADPVLSGHEPLYSAVCAAPCAPESAVQPWSESTVRLQVRPETLAVEADQAHQVSAVASAWFDRERRGSGPWLTPTSPGASIGHLADWPWSVAAPADAPGAAGVPLGLLMRVQDAWYLDTWSARRDVMAPQTSAAWRQRMGRRPEAVFTAQLLQFQDQLARAEVGPQHPLADRFVELPPAGFLPMPALPGEVGIETWLEQVFGSSVDLQINSCSADAAISAVGLASDLDRTPLQHYGSDARPQLLVLLPTLPAHLPAVHTQRYPWLAFVRLPRLEPLRDGHGPQGSTDDAASTGGPSEPAPPVRVFVADAPWVRADYYRTTGALVEGTPQAEVRFTRAGWHAELDPETRETVRAAVEDGGEYTDVDVVVTTGEASREPLVTARARALAEELGLGSGQADRSVGIYSMQLDGPDTVVLMVRRKR